MQAPVIETERLLMRPNREEDFEAFAAFYASDRARLRGGIKTRWQAWMQFAAEIGHWSLRNYGFWAVEEKATGMYCGQVGLWNPEGWPEPEVGWMLVAEAEGRGIAFEAALRARDYAYHTLNWTRLASCISQGNERSIRLADRMGATFDRRVPYKGIPDHLVYLHPTPDLLT